MAKETPPNLVIQEPSATGWQRTEIYGNRELGKTHVKAAREVLGGLRSRTGVNERIAAGEAGGFYHQWSMLPDGTRVHAFTNDGHDTVRIYAPGYTPEPAEEPPEPKPKGTPYMWVGLRVRYDQCRTDRYALCANMVEPNGAKYRGIVTDNWVWSWAGYGSIMQDGDKMVRCKEENYYETPGGNPILRTYPYPWTVEELMQQLQADFVVEGSNFWLSQDHKQLRDHNFWIDSVEDDANFYCTANGLRLYSTEGRSGGTVSAELYRASERWGPYDPLMDDAQNAGEGRDTSGRIAEGDEYYGLTDADVVRGWDRVFVLDPFEDEMQSPCDKRAHILGASKALYEAGMARGAAQVLAGEYMLTVCAQGETADQSERAGENIPVEHVPTLKRGAYCDYLGRIVPQEYTKPLVVEVEVRLGKIPNGGNPDDPGMAVFNFELTCDDYHTYENVVLPFGYGSDADYDECTGYPGMNPLGPNFSDFIAIDVNARSARLVTKDKVDLAPVFGGGGHYKPLGTNKGDLDVYIFGDYGVSQVDQVDYARKAGQALYKMLELATSGTWNCVNLVERSEAELIAACAGIEKGYVWRYSSIANSITALPIIDSTDAMKADPTYDDWLGWYYPYRKATRSECRVPMAILLQADEVFVYNAGAGYGPDDNTNHDCC